MLSLARLCRSLAPFSQDLLAPSNGRRPTKSTSPPLAAAHKANPADPAAALAYAKALRNGGAKAEALAVLERRRPRPGPPTAGCTLERGLLALELGETAKAETLLRPAHDPRRPTGGCIRRWARRWQAAASSRRRRRSSPRRWRWRPTTRACSTTSRSPTRWTARPAKPRSCCARPRPKPARTPQVQQNLALVLGLRRQVRRGARGGARRPCRPPRPATTSPICRGWRAPRRSRLGGHVGRQRRSGSQGRAGEGQCQPAAADLSAGRPAAARRLMARRPRRAKKPKGPVTLSTEPPWITPGKIELQGKGNLGRRR